MVLTEKIILFTIFIKFDNIAKILKYDRKGIWCFISKTPWKVKEK